VGQGKRLKGQIAWRKKGGKSSGPQFYPDLNDARTQPGLNIIKKTHQQMMKKNRREAKENLQSEVWTFGPVRKTAATEYEVDPFDRRGRKKSSQSCGKGLS